MTRRDWLSIALKTTGVILVIVYLSNLVIMAGLFLTLIPEGLGSGGGNLWQSVLVTIAFACGLLLGVLLIRDGDGLADRLLGVSSEEENDEAEEEEEEKDGSAEPPALFGVALKVIGVGCVVEAVVRLFLHASVISLLADSFNTRAVWMQQLAWPVSCWESASISSSTEGG